MEEKVGPVPSYMAGNRPYGEFYDFYCVSPEYFGYHHVYGNSFTEYVIMEQKVVYCISVMWNVRLLCEIISISKLHDL
jgi:hypothetical protein